MAIGMVNRATLLHACRRAAASRCHQGQFKSIGDPKPRGSTSVTNNVDILCGCSGIVCMLGLAVEQRRIAQLIRILITGTSLQPSMVGKRAPV